MGLSCCKKLFALSRGTNTKHIDDFCLFCLHFLEAKTKLNYIKNHVKIHFFLNIGMSSKDTKKLEFNRYQKSDKAQFIIYAELESLIKKVD